MVEISNYALGNILHETPAIEINTSDKIAIVGRNGRGKTTMLRLLAGIVFPETGIGVFKNKEYSFPINTKQRIQLSKFCRQEIFYAEGLNFLYPNLSTKENIDYYTSVQEYDINKLYRILDLLDYNATFDKKVKLLSLGTKQKLVASLSLASKKELIICDEPTLGFDSESKKVYFDALLEEKEKSFVISTNDAEVYKFFDKFLLCNNRSVELLDAYPNY